MKDIINIVNKFLDNYRDLDDYVGAIVCGSYSVGNENEYSDIDIRIYLDSTTFFGRGNAMFEGKIIEYFICSVEKQIDDLKNEYSKNYFISGNMLLNGIIIDDKNSQIKKLKEKALEYYNKEFINPDEEILKMKYYCCYDLLNELKLEKNNFIYFELLNNLISTYCYENKLGYISIKKLYRLYSNEEYRKKYKYLKLPNFEFIKIVISCIENIEINSILKLYDYVIKKEKFDIRNIFISYIL